MTKPQPLKLVNLRTSPRFRLGARVTVSYTRTLSPEFPGEESSVSSVLYEGQVLGCQWQLPNNGVEGHWIYYVMRSTNWVTIHPESDLIPVPVEPVPYDPSGLPPDGWPDTNDAPLTIDERRQIHNLLGHLQRAHRRAEQLVTRSVNLAADLDRLITSNADALRRVLWACPVPVDPPVVLEEDSQP